MPKEHRKNKRKSTYNKHTRRKPGQLYDLNKDQGKKNTKYVCHAVVIPASGGMRGFTT